MKTTIKKNNNDFLPQQIKNSKPQSKDIEKF